MKSIKKILTTMLAVACTASLAACGADDDTTTPATNAPMNNGNYSAPVTTKEEFYTQTSVQATDSFADTDATMLSDISETAEITEETEITEDLTFIPNTMDFMSSVSDTLNAAESFEMTCNIKGYVPDKSSDIGKLIEHEFVYTVKTNTTHLKSSSRDLNIDDSDTSYEEYQTLADNIVTTLTPYDKIWVDNTPKEIIRYNMAKKALNSVALVSILTGDSQLTSDTFINAELTRNETGDFILTVKNWSDVQPYTDDFTYHTFSGMIRSPEMKDYLFDLGIQNSDGGISYTFDKDYNLKGIVFDVLNHGENYDIHGEISFTKWNSVNNITIPRVSKIEETTAAADTEANSEATIEVNDKTESEATTE